MPSTQDTAQAREITEEDYSVISVIGDGALTGGMAYEALNNAAQIRKNFIIVLNDNEMSISRNVGGMSKYLSSVRTKEGYAELKLRVERTLSAIPVIGRPLTYGLYQLKNGIKQFLVPGMLFEDMGITYLGPVDGHDMRQMMRLFNEAKRVKGPVVVHVLTESSAIPRRGTIRYQDRKSFKEKGVSELHGCILREDLRTCRKE